jgi:hypothetical protein
VKDKGLTSNKEQNKIKTINLYRKDDNTHISQQTRQNKNLHSTKNILMPNLANESVTYKNRKKYQFDQYLGFLKTKLAL